MVICTRSRTAERTESLMPENFPLLRGTLPAIAIDGPAGVGKSSVGKEAAARLGWKFIDTGAMYRSLALVVSEKKLPQEKWEEVMTGLDIRFVPGENNQRVFIGEREVTKAIRTPEITAQVKYAADHPGVRRAARALQKKLAADGNVVMEGRDICQFVLPDARYKFFLDASLEARIERRVKQLADDGIHADPAEVATAMAKRDEEDRKRDIAPLTPSPDVFYIDNTHLTKHEVVEFIISLVEADRAANAG